MEYQKIELVKDGNNHSLYYENEEKMIEKKISKDEFKKIFENIEPNFSFSLPDKLIQHFIKDGSIIPSFKQSHQFTKEDFNELVDPLRSELKYIDGREPPKPVNVRKYIKNKTKKRRNKNNKQKNKDKILEKLSNIKPRKRGRRTEHKNRNKK